MSKQLSAQHLWYKSNSLNITFPVPKTTNFRINPCSEKGTHFTHTDRSDDSQNAAYPNARSYEDSYHTEYFVDF